MGDEDKVDYTIRAFRGKNATTPLSDNVDVEVIFGTGERFSATFFSLENIRALMTRYRETGECASGTYFWAKDMVVVMSVDDATIAKAVRDLIDTDEFRHAFRRL
jgi:hypothetical protein